MGGKDTAEVPLGTVILEGTYTRCPSKLLSVSQNKRQKVNWHLLGLLCLRLPPALGEWGRGQ